MGPRRRTDPRKGALNRKIAAVRTLAGICLILTVAIGCTSERPGAGDPSPVTVSWREVTLPMPAGRAGRIAVRDAVKCGDQWHITGAVYLGGPSDTDYYGDSKPAVWRSTDGAQWESVRFAPRTYWGGRAVILSAACHDGQLALLGAKPGGAHGNPRVTTWYLRKDGVFTDVDAPFELYGGPRAVSVERMAAGDTGWLIVGNRISGGAVWISPHAREFTLIDADPELGSDARTDTAARDAAHTDAGWIVVGNASLKGRIARVPLSWTSEDGRTWQRLRMPYGREYTDAQRVIGYRDGVIAVGIQGERFTTWRRSGHGAWRRGGGFGAIADGRASPFVSGFTVAGDGVLAAVSDSVRYGLWASPDGERWRPVKTPSRPTTAGEHLMTAVGAGEQLVLLVDDGRAGRVWLADRAPYS